MTSNLFDTRFETSLRLAVLLDEVGGDVSADYLQAVDFMSVYGKAFSVSDASLNGDNPFMFCELASRRELVRSSLRELVLKGYVLPVASSNGFLYRPTYEGRRFAETLSDDFSSRYRQAVAAVLEGTEGADGNELMERLTAQARESIKGLRE